MVYFLDSGMSQLVSGIHGNHDGSNYEGRSILATLSQATASSLQGKAGSR